MSSPAAHSPSPSADPLTASPLGADPSPASAPAASGPTRAFARDHREPGSAPRWRIGVGAVVVAVVVLLGVGVVVSAVSSADDAGALTVSAQGAAGAPGPSGSSGGATASASSGPSSGAGSTSALGSGSAGQASTASGASTVFVHILGQVVKPGLYQIPRGSRAVDAVSAAGGFTPKADQASLNLAAPVVDGEQLVVVAVGEAPAPVVSAAGGGPAPAGPVDLNTADATALENLPGVGPATAQAILDWRQQNGRFQSVDDLLDVTGIGDKKLERMRDAVTVR
jgi:competence protein ComEA